MAKLMVERPVKAEEELDRQLQALLAMGYPALMGRDEASFRSLVQPLVEKATTLGELSWDRDRLPLVLVLDVPPEQAMPLVEVRGKPGVVNVTPIDVDSFQPRPELSLPKGEAYLLLDVDIGREWLNVPPAQVFPKLEEGGRSPLTVREGVAVLTALPEVLADKQRYCAYSLLGSRRGDQRVPAIWISYKQPRLGWCWDNAPHTWMGSASCAGRVG